MFGTWTGVITYNVSMEDNGATPAPTLISFTIDGTSYQAEEGMTWEEWVNSGYNTYDFYIKNGNAISTSNKSSSYTVRRNRYLELPTYVINNNTSYTLEPGVPPKE